MSYMLRIKFKNTNEYFDAREMFTEHQYTTWVSTEFGEVYVEIGFTSLMGIKMFKDYCKYFPISCQKIVSSEILHRVE